MTAKGKRTCHEGREPAFEVSTERKEEEGNKDNVGLLEEQYGYEYSVEILQEPLQARMSGLTNTASRRMLDPPLVLKVNLNGQNVGGKSLKENDKLNLARQLVCLVELVDADGNNQSFASTEYDTHLLSDLDISRSTKTLRQGQIIDQSKVLTLLLGQTARSCSYMYLSQKEKSLVFIFSDLSIRVQGQYRLNCSVVHVERYYTSFSRQEATTHTLIH